MESYGFLLDVAIILISTKLFGLLTKRIEMPQVVGALLAGIILGPGLIGILHETEFMDQIAEIGVIVLMFSAGLETDMQELKKTGKSSFVIALIGVLVPLVCGYFLASFFNSDSANPFLENMFIGIILTATSVSISVETLKEMGKLNTDSGNAILGAALIDDILGIIGLTIITGMADTSVNLFVVLMKIIAFFALSGIVGIFARKFIKYWFDRHDRVLRRFSVLSFAFCLIFAFVAEHFFGVADITGAFIAGLIISNTSKCTYVASRMETLSYMLISPVFFASIGLKVVLPDLTSEIILFSVLLCIIALLSKVIGCGIGAKVCGFANVQSKRIGVGMISRGEVALIVASKGIALGLMNEAFFGPIIIMVVFTTVITPILLKFVFKEQENDPDAVLVRSELAEHYEEAINFEVAAQAMLNQHIQAKEKLSNKG